MMSDALQHVAAERGRQIDKGWTTEHDSEHGLRHLTWLAQKRTSAAAYEAAIGTWAVRSELVKAAALLVAAIELIDFRESVLRESVEAKDE